ncbi:MAG: O-antigen ligase family protein [bacterium]|nr:O-antigen ligase family protein [bacterium]
MENSSLYVKILKWGIFISLFLPLVIFSQYISPFHFGKMIIFRILVELMAVFYFVLILIDKSYRPKWSPVLIGFSVFTVLYVLMGIIGVDFYNSFWGSLERMGGIFSFLHFWVYFVILISIIKSKKDWQKVLKISVLVGFLSILFAYGQRLELGNFFVGWQHGERVIGTIGNPALFAGYLLFIIYLALLFLLQKETPIKEKGFFVAVIILGVPVLLMTAVRGAMLSLLGSALLLILFFIFKASSKKARIGLLIAIILIVSLAGIAWTNKDSSWVKNISWLSRLTDISKGTDTIQTRLWSWDSAINGWKERPIFGWGPENFTFLHMKYFDARHFTHMGSETIWDRAHNMVLEQLSTTGVVGLLSYLSIFFIIFYLLVKRFKQGRVDKIDFGVVGVMIIAYFGQNLFIFDTFANYFLFFLSLGYINFLTQDSLKEENTEQEKTIIQKTPSPFLITILLILAIILGYQTGIKPAQANFACTRAIIAGRDGNGQKALDKYREALNYKNPQGAYEIRHKLAAFVIQVVDSQRQKNKDFDPAILYYAISETEKNVEKYSLDTTPYLYIGRMYILLMSKEPGAGDKAEQYIQKAIDLNPNNPRIWYEMGQAKLSNKKYQESYDSFKKALDLNPKVNLSWWFLSNVAFQLERYDEAVYDAEKAIELGYSGYQSSITDLMRLVTIYEKSGNYSKVLEYYIMAAEEQPQNPQIHASLAVAYAKMGYRDEAIKSALKAAELDPGFKDEADKFIQSLSR